jgi:hypothetical protein
MSVLSFTDFHFRNSLSIRYATISKKNASKIRGESNPLLTIKLSTRMETTVEETPMIPAERRTEESATILFIPAAKVVKNVQANELAMVTATISDSGIPSRRAVSGIIKTKTRPPPTPRRPPMYPAKKPQKIRSGKIIIRMAKFE